MKYDVWLINMNEYVNTVDLDWTTFFVFSFWLIEFYFGLNIWHFQFLRGGEEIWHQRQRFTITFSRHGITFIARDSVCVLFNRASLALEQQHHEKYTNSQIVFTIRIHFQKFEHFLASFTSIKFQEKAINTV